MIGRGESEGGREREGERECGKDGGKFTCTCTCIYMVR